MMEPGYQRFAEAVERRRIAGSGFRTGIALFLVTVALFDLLGIALGSGGVVSLLLSGVPPGARAPATAVIIGYALNLTALAVGLNSLAQSPWWRWLGPSLRANLPLRELFVAVCGRGNVADLSWPRVTIHVLAWIVAAAAVSPNYGLLMHWQSMPAFGAILVLGVFSFVCVWLAGMFYENAISRSGTLTRGDRPTVVGLMLGVFVSIAAAIASPEAMEQLASYGFDVSGSLWFRLTAFYVAWCALMILTAMCLGSITDRDIEILQVDSGSMVERHDLPDCTGGAFTPFLFRVETQGNQVLLVSVAASGASSAQVLTTLDPHDLTAGRYSLVNLTALARRRGRAVTVGFSELLRGRFSCRISVELATNSVEAFLTDLRREGGHFPIETLAFVSDRVLAEGMQAGVLSELFLGTVMETEVAVMQRMPDPFPEIRSLLDTAITVATDNAAAIDSVVTVFQDENSSAVSLRRDRLTAQDAVALIAEHRNAFQNQLATLKLSLRGEDQLRAEVYDAVREAAADGLGAVLMAVADDEPMIREGRKLLRLFSLRVADLVIERSPVAVEVEAALFTIENEFQASQSRALHRISEISQALGNAQTGLATSTMSQPALPYEVRAQLARHVVESLTNAAESQPSLSRRNEAPSLGRSERNSQLPSADGVPVHSVPDSSPAQTSDDRTNCRVQDEPF